MDDFESLTVDLYEKYETQVRPGLDAINLPAYFGGITLKNKTLESLDLCQLIASLRNTNSRSQYLKGLFNIILIIALYPKLRLWTKFMTILPCLWLNFKKKNTYCPFKGDYCCFFREMAERSDSWHVQFLALLIFDSERSKRTLMHSSYSCSWKSRLSLCDTIKIEFLFPISSHPLISQFPFQFMQWKKSNWE